MQMSHQLALHVTYILTSDVSYFHKLKIYQVRKRILLLLTVNTKQYIVVNYSIQHVHKTVHILKINIFYHL